MNTEELEARVRSLDDRLRMLEDVEEIEESPDNVRLLTWSTACGRRWWICFPTTPSQSR